MAQGAAQAIEDGATLASCLTRVEPPEEALRLYESLRLPRTSRIQALSATNKTRFHLPDGSEQEERDEQMAGGSTDWSIKAVAWIYGHDAAEIDVTPVAAGEAAPRSP
jgi:salicylate hydroxylase